MLLPSDADAELECGLVHTCVHFTYNYFVVSSTVGNVGLCNPAHLIGLWLECMACTLGDCSTTSFIKLLNTTLLYLVA